MLARVQSQQVARELERLNAGLTVELVLVKTVGDQITDRPLHEFGGKGLFTSELEQSLLRNEIDLAVHSMKDVPVTMPLVDTARLVIAAVPKREDPRDALVSADGVTLEALRPGARVGTGSLRRRAQLLALRPDVSVVPIRGNVDTRLKRAIEGNLDATVLAVAGLHRCGLFDQAIAQPLDADRFIPAAGQGALAIQCRRDDPRTRALVAKLSDDDTSICVEVERSIVAGLNGDCHSPIAALAVVKEGRIRLSAAVAARDGGAPLIRASAEAAVGSAREAKAGVLDSLVSQGALELLHAEANHACA
jgi:hydroxymethylbilane synthase